MKFLLISVGLHCLIYTTFTANLYGQNCTAKVPDNATVISVEQTITEGGVYWICSDGQVDVPSEIQATFYLESGGILNLTSNQDTVYVNKEAQLNIVGNGNIVFARSGSNIDIVGNDNIVFAEDGANIVSVGLNNVNNSTDCSSITFDYSDAPTEGCAFIGDRNCVALIPNSATVVTSEQSIMEDGVYWICVQGQVDVPSPIKGTFYIEAGVTLNLVSNEDTIYINDGGFLDLVGDGNVVYIRNGGDAILLGNNNTFYVESEVDINVVGGGNQVSSTECEDINFDYNQAPANGCTTTSILNAQYTNQISIYPIPVEEHINIAINGDLKAGEVEIYNIHGQLVEQAALEPSGKSTLSLRNHADGIYIVLVRNEDLSYQQRVLKQ